MTEYVNAARRDAAYVLKFKLMACGLHSLKQSTVSFLFIFHDKWYEDTLYNVQYSVDL